MKNIIFLAVQGAGKGTFAKKLQENMDMLIYLQEIYLEKEQP